MITFTKEKLIASAYARIEFAEMMLSGELEPLKERTWSIELELARIALASLEAEAVGEIIEQQSGMMLDGLVISEKPTYRNIKGIHNMKMMPLGTQFYTAPPAPIVPDFKKLARELVENLVDCDGADDSAVKQYLKWTERTCRAAMLQGADGNSPWVACSERMPDKLIPVMVMYADGEMWAAIWTGTKWDDGTEFPDPHAVTHWQEMPAAPQQEVK